MRILIAEDDPISRRVLLTRLEKWEFDVTAVENGQDAFDILTGENPPPMAILDWMMPKLDGIEVCRKLRKYEPKNSCYIMLLTAKTQRSDLVSGLEAGADDYITKPFHTDELKARIQVGKRIINLQSSLAERVIELEKAMAEIKHLKGILPICSYCKKVRDEEDHWMDIDTYLSINTNADLSHSICPDCYTEQIVPQLEARKKRKKVSFEALNQSIKSND